MGWMSAIRPMRDMPMATAIETPTRISSRMEMRYSLAWISYFMAVLLFLLILVFYYTEESDKCTEESVYFGEDEMYTDNTDHVTMQNFSGISVDDDGYIYAMDSAYGKIYVYDGECNSITVIGCGLGTGEHKGSFSTPSAIENYNNQLLVADSKKNTITVFSLTDYGKLIYKADTLSQEGEYEQAGEYWQQALNMSSSFQMTYRGLAQAEYMKSNYKEAIRYAKLAKDQVLYANAFKQLSNIFIANNLWWIIILIIIFAGI